MALGIYRKRHDSPYFDTIRRRVLDISTRRLDVSKYIELLKMHFPLEKNEMLLVLVCTEKNKGIPEIP